MIELRDLREAPAEQIAAWLGAIAGNLRPLDRLEIEATSDLDPTTALIASAMVSELAWVLLVGGEPVAVFGVAPSGCEGSGMVWLMGTPAMDDTPTALARFTRRGLRMMHRRFPCLWNYIDARNEPSMRWLLWSGFRLLEAHPEHGREGRLFFTFARYQHIV